MAEPNRRADAQINFRVEREAAELIRRAFPRRGELTTVAAELLVAAARQRLAAQPELEEGVTAA